MKQVSILIFLFFYIGLHAQPRIIAGNEEPYTPESLVTDKFIGSGVIVNSLVHDGVDHSIGFFAGYENLLDFDEGIILSTGSVLDANTPNNSDNVSSTTSNTSLDDSDISAIVGNSELFDVSRIVINFVPLSDSISFNYIFASEEYNEFVCSDFNDIFGFFLSGPNPDGGMFDGENIALVPDPSDPNGNTFLDLPVRINTVNNGIVPPFPGDPDNCMAPDGSLAFSQYFNDNPAGNLPTFDGFLDVFKAKSQVIPCEEYQMSIVIADVVDRDFDSAVFLEAKSFGAGFLEVVTEAQSVDGTLAEGCSEGSLVFQLPEIKDEDFVIPLTLLDPNLFPDAAELDLDFTDFPSQATILAGESTVTLPITILDDDLDEGVEFIYFDVPLNACQRDTIKVSITDDLLEQIMLPDDITVCPDESVLINPEYPADFFVPQPQVFTNSEDIQIVQEGQQYISTIMLDGLNPEVLNRNFFRSICIDTFIARNLNDFDFFIRGPDDQLMELTTDNGLKANNETDIDTFINTCFSIVANVNINNNNAVEGPVYIGNETYSGNFFPEGNWDDLFISNDASANGVWKLIIVGDQPQSMADINAGLPVLKSWSINFFAAYSIDFNWYQNGVEQPCTFCLEQTITPVGPEPDSIVFEMIDSRGCMSLDTMVIGTFDRVLPVTNPTCLDEDFSQITIGWDASPNANCYQIKLDPAEPWLNIGNVTTYTATGLQFDQLVTFFIRAKDDNCVSSIVTLECMTPACPPPLAQLVSSTESTCYQSPDAGIEVLASGGSGGPYTYSIQGQTNQTGIFQGLLGGDDIVFITDASDCPFELNVVIPQPDEVQVDFTIIDISCTDADDGELTALPLGIFPPFDILWDDNSIDAMRTMLAEGWYTVTVSDANGCEKIDSAFITNPQLNELSNLIISEIECFGDNDGSIEVLHTGGTPPYVYSWSNSESTRIIEDLGPGIYELTITDDRACELILEPIELIEPPLLTLQTQGNSISCYNSLDGVASVMADGGVEPYVFLWDNGSNGSSIFNIGGGDYEVTVTDANNCMEVASVTIEAPDSLIYDFMLVEPSCFGFEDGQITITTDPTYTIEWDDGSSDFVLPNIGQGNYCFVITDGSGCTNDGCISLPQPAVISINETVFNVTCDNDLDGSISIEVEGGVGNYGFNWAGPNFTSNQQNISGLGLGIYNLVVIDENLCQYNFQFEVESNSPIDLMFFEENILCAGSNTGALAVVASGATYPLMYEWEGTNVTTATDSLIVELFAGEYGVTVTDANSCASSALFTITEEESLEISLVEVVDVICGGQSTGALTIDVQGGVPPYNYLWDNGSVSSSIMNVPAGAYTVIVTDSNNCQDSETFEINENGPLWAQWEIINARCEGDTNGSININGTGGAGEYIYALNGGDYTPNGNFIGLGQGFYFVEIQDLNDCEVYVDSLIIEEEYNINLDLGDNIVLDFGDSLTLSAVVDGNLDGLTYQWSALDPSILSCLDCPNPQTNSLTESMEIKLEVTNIHGCTDVDYVIISLAKGVIVKVPTGFSPNGDGQNDLLQVFGKPGTMINSFRVYSRWGEVVFEQKNFEVNGPEGWSGRYKGALLDPGVFHYVIEALSPDGTLELVKGNTTLIR